MSLTNKVAQFDADSDLVNAWVHGGPTSSITTASGTVPSPAKLIRDNETEIQAIIDLTDAWANGPATGPQSTVVIGGAVVKTVNKVAADVDTQLQQVVNQTNAWASGPATGAGSTVTLGGAVVSTPSKLIADQNAAINVGAASVLALATTQAAIATDKATIASQKAELATTNGNAQVLLATAEKNAAVTAKVAAELAREVALIQAGVYATEALGRAAVADGVAFKVQGSGDVAAYEYRRTGSATSVLIATYPSNNAVTTISNRQLLKADLLFTKNLLNINDPDVVLGAFPNHTNGVPQVNIAYNCSGFIPIVAGLSYAANTKHYVVWYDSNKVFISGSNDSDVNRVYVAPANAAFLRISTSLGMWAQTQVEQNITSTFFEVWGKYLASSQIQTKGLETRMYATSSITPETVNFLQAGKNLFNKNTRVSGQFYGHDGIIGTLASLCYSDFIAVSPNTLYSSLLAPDMRFVCYFDINKNFVSGGLSENASAFTTPASVYFVRITTLLATVDNFQFEKGGRTAFTPFSYVLKLTNGTVINAVPAAEEVTSPMLAPASVTPSKTDFMRAGKNLFNLGKVVGGFVDPNSGSITASDAYKTSEFISVTAGQTYFGRGYATNMRFVAYFNSAQVLVAGGSLNSSDSFTVPAGVSFVRIAISTADLATFQLEKSNAQTAYEPYGFILVGASGENISFPAVPVIKPWGNKTWAAMADSLGGTGWQSAVATATGLVWTNFSTGGTKISGSVGDTSAMCQDTRINAIPTTVDLITVQGGTNDWAQNVLLGSVNSTDPLTFYGALNTLLSKLSLRFPAKRVVLLTTAYGELYNFAARGWANAYTNTAGLTTWDYAEAIRIACSRWGTPCIDVAAKAGWNSINIRTYVADDGGLLHPNAVGARRIAEVTIGELLNITPLV